MKKRFTEAQIVGFLREVDAGVAVKDLCRKHGFSEPATTCGGASSGA
jgi:putative transposase